MALTKAILMAMVIMYTMSHKAYMVGAQVHHVVGGDRGWDSANDLASWLAGRVFRVGDRLWFTYSAAEGRIAEVRTQEEFLKCDLRNPIRMYTDGLESVALDGEGVRYFTSSNIESCKNGLKLHVNVMPQQMTGANTPMDVAAFAPTPSTSSYLLPPASFSFWVAALCLFLGLLVL